MMAGFSCFLFAVILLLALSFVCEISQAYTIPSDSPTIRPTGGEGSLRPNQCGPACAYRCSATSHKKPCLFFCNKCCTKCLCVPSGTYGHKEECPCYNNWKTKEGKPKCP